MRPHHQPLPPAAPGPMPPLLRLLAELRHHSRRWALVRYAWATGTLSAGLTLAALAISATGRPYAGAAVALAAVAVFATSALLVGLVALWGRISSSPLTTVAAATQAGALAARLTPKLSSAVPTAISLWQNAPLLPPGTLSAAHVGATLAAFETARPMLALERQARLQLRPWRRACGRLAAICALVAVWQNEAARALISVLRHEAPVQQSRVPLVGDIAITLTPPPYTGLTVQQLPVGAGNIRALVGSEVVVQGRTDSVYAQGALRLQPDARVVLNQDAEVPGLWRGTFVAEHSGSYTYLFTGPNGVQIRDAIDHGIEVVPDTPPEATLVAPEADVVLRDGDIVTVLWRACDDFGLASTVLHIEPQDGDPAWDLPLTAERRGPHAGQDVAQRLGPGVCFRGKLNLNARDLHLTPGPGVVMTLVATDTAPGPAPGSTSSAPKTVSLFSARAHHEELLALQQQALDGMVDWLALELELRCGPPPSPTGQKGTASVIESPLPALVAQVTTVHGQLSHLAQQLQDDVHSDDGERLAISHVLQHTESARASLLQNQAALAALSWAAQATAHSPPKSPHGRRVAALERDIIYLDRLLGQGRLDVVRDSAKDLLAAKAELQELLAKSKNQHDPALRAQVQARMAALKTQMRAMMQKMAALRPALPQGFANAEAYAHSPMDETLERIDKGLQSDNIDDVARDLEHLANMVDNAVEELTTSQDEEAAAQHTADREKLSQVAQQLNALTQKQAALVEKGQKLAAAAIKEAAGGAAEGATQPRVQAVLDMLQRAQDAAQTLAADAFQGQAQAAPIRRLSTALSDAQGLLRQGALAQAAARLREGDRMAQDLSARAQHMAQAAAHMVGGQEARAALGPARTVGTQTHAARAALDALVDRAQSAMSPGLQRRAQSLAQAQDALAQEAQRTTDALAQMSQDGPLVGAEGSAQMQSAQQHMRAAAQGIGSRALEAGGMQQHQALEALQQLQASMQQNGSGQGQQKPGQSGGRSRRSSGGVPRPMGQPRPGQAPGGPGGSDGKDEVKIPFDHNEPGPDFKQQLLEAAKQRPPLHYEEAARRYHDELIR